ncbi:sulfite exporter TauE/SafE family protein [Mucilaginibacter limnophilus]|uniref:Probable membrane transporter protein n=1 Tax=Mucilaginibacter limnophilus TaxID=1932778 RepID=A0A437MWH4_9SPHI|nr:sulfite exporter TauE/SafE family protein [Mucilaginibacter limnophilus]RVU02032.1 sulfite exporter TauE/SafE family protein [Mucilaginibacter limnophilus]
MTILIFTLILFLGAYAAGFLGSLTGLGGGFVIIPLLTILLHVDIHYAVGASLVSAIATSSGSAAAYVKEGITNMRLGIFLEIATTIGAFIGALVAVYISAHYIALLFGFILIASSIISLRKKENHINTKKSYLADKLKLDGEYPDGDTHIPYKIANVGGGFFLMMLAGMVSGIIGIGSGALKVVVMDGLMRIPFKVSTTTSNFMIGVTAAASAVIYLQRGYIDPGVCMPVVIGVVLGAITGSKILVKTQSSNLLKWLFAGIIFLLAVQMIYRGLSGQI